MGDKNPQSLTTALWGLCNLSPDFYFGTPPQTIPKEKPCNAQSRQHFKIGGGGATHKDAPGLSKGVDACVPKTQRPSPDLSKGFFWNLPNPSKPQTCQHGKGGDSENPPGPFQNGVSCNVQLMGKAYKTRSMQCRQVFTPVEIRLALEGCELKQGKPRQSFWGFGPPGHSGGTSLGRRGQGHGRVTRLSIGPR